MKCSKCGCFEDKVIDSRISKEGNSVRRRRECLNCTYRFTTLEEIVPSEIYVIKRDQSRVDFKPNNIRDGIKKACWKRPVSDDQLERIYERINQFAENFGDRDIPSEEIGKYIMKELKQLDDIAYVRFASVYRQFKDIDELLDEIKTLKDQ